MIASQITKTLPQKMLDSDTTLIKIIKGSIFDVLIFDIQERKVIKINSLILENALLKDYKYSNMLNHNLTFEMFVTDILCCRLDILRSRYKNFGDAIKKHGEQIATIDIF